MKVFKSPHLLTELEIWYPKYSTQYNEGGERAVLLAKYKVDHATPWIRIRFSKAKHLIGQRYCVEKAVAQAQPVVMNGSSARQIECYSVNMSLLENWISDSEHINEIKNTLEEISW